MLEEMFILHDCLGFQNVGMKWSARVSICPTFCLSMANPFIDIIMSLKKHIENISETEVAQTCCEAVHKVVDIS